MVKLDKIYTRGGDRGETSLGDGTRTPKHSLRIDAQGEIDEANAAVGLSRTHSTNDVSGAALARIQNDLFDLGADIARPGSNAADGKLVVLDSAKLKAAKTAGLAKKLTKLGWSSVLVIDGAEVDDNFARAAANIVGLDVLPSQGANVYDILRRDTLVLTTDAIEKLVERLK